MALEQAGRLPQDTSLWRGADFKWGDQQQCTLRGANCRSDGAAHVHRETCFSAEVLFLYLGVLDSNVLRMPTSGSGSPLRGTGASTWRTAGWSWPGDFRGQEVHAQKINPS